MQGAALVFAKPHREYHFSQTFIRIYSRLSRTQHLTHLNITFSAQIAASLRLANWTMFSVFTKQNKMWIKINKIDCSSWCTRNHYNLYTLVVATASRIHFNWRLYMTISFVCSCRGTRCAHPNVCQQQQQQQRQRRRRRVARRMRRAIYYSIPAVLREFSAHIQNNTFTAKRITAMMFANKCAARPPECTPVANKRMWNGKKLLFRAAESYSAVEN